MDGDVIVVGGGLAGLVATGELTDAARRVLLPVGGELVGVDLSRGERGRPVAVHQGRPRLRPHRRRAGPAELRQAPQTVWMQTWRP